MKLTITIIAVVILTANVFAQTPGKMSYQSVIRDAGDNLVTNQQIGMQITIFQDSVSGTVVYVETQTITTNANGLVSIEIGTGTTSYDFSSIDWANGPYFIQTETDPAGDTNYTITGTSQLLSVPYAFYAKTAETLTGGVSANDFYLGQDTLGGIVFHIYLDENGDQRGLIVSKTETTELWQSTASATNATRSWDGAYNMNLMTNSPAKDWITSSFSINWYLPSIDELSILYKNRFHVNKALNDANETLLSNIAWYWSSTEFDATNAFLFSFHNGSQAHGPKTNTYSVRAVKAF